MAGEVGEMVGNAGPVPRGWTVASLNEIAQINPRANWCVIHDDIEVTFVPMRAVEGEGGGLLRPESRRYREVKKGYTSFLSGDVIMAKITPCMENGKTTVVPEVPGQVCFGSTEFHVVRPEPGIQPRWIAQFLLQHDVRRLAQRQMAGGVGQMRVPVAFLEEVRVPLAPCSEQERIADALDELFSDLDAAMAALERVLAKLKLYRVSVLKAGVEGALTADWRAQHPQIEPATELLDRILVERRRRWEEDQLAKFKDKGQQPPTNWKAKYMDPGPAAVTKLPPLPDGWCWGNTGQLCEFITKGTTPSGSESPQSNGDIPFIKVQHLSGIGAFHFQDSPSYVSRSTHEGFLARSKVFPGDILMNIVGPPLGQVSIVPATHSEWNVNQAIAIFRPIDGILRKYLAFSLLSQPVISQALRRTKTTAGQVNLTLEVCRDLAIPLAPLEEQEAIVEAVEDQISVIDHLEADLDVKLKSAQSLRQSILRHAFTAKLVAQDPNEEPASELLKRIAAERQSRADGRAMQKSKKQNGQRNTTRARRRRFTETNA